MRVIPSPSHYSVCDMLSSREAPQGPSTQGLCRLVTGTLCQARTRLQIEGKQV